MINEEMTKKEFGYYSTDLSSWSSKLVYVRCSECKKYRTVRYQAYVKRKSDRCVKCLRGVQRGPFNIEYFQAIQESVVESRINELRTFEEFGYYSKDFNKGSDRKVYLVCIKCRQEWLTQMKRYIKGTGKCLTCVRVDKSQELRAKCGEKNPVYGKHHTDETKCKISVGNIGKHISTETRRRCSATQQDISYEEWVGFVTDNPYCKKFNN